MRPFDFEQTDGGAVAEPDRLLQAGGAEYDIIVPSDYMVQILVSENMLEPLDYGNIPNIANMGPVHVNQYFDPNQEYTVPYFWGTSGFAVDTNVVPDPAASWST